MGTVRPHIFDGSSIRPSPTEDNWLGTQIDLPDTTYPVAGFCALTKGVLDGRLPDGGAGGKVLVSKSETGQPRRQRPGPGRAASVRIALVLAVFAALFTTALPADAHGAQTRPGSRTYLCRIDGTHSSGDIQPSNAACAAAIAIGGKQPLWDWFGVLRSDGGGRTRGYIPDGQLCSGGEPKYAGYDLARNDWPYTSLTGGTDLTVRYNAWAAHPGQFRLYVTKDGYDPTQPLRWDDLEDQPFSVYDQSSPNGNDAENGTPDYQWNVTLPNKSGQHIIYSVWSRSDSEETFYGCSDVRFDGGSGQVFGVGAGANPVGAPESTSAPATTSAPTPANPPASVVPDVEAAAANPDTPATTMPYGAAPDEAADAGANADPATDSEAISNGATEAAVAGATTGTDAAGNPAMVDGGLPAGVVAGQEVAAGQDIVLIEGAADADGQQVNVVQPAVAGATADTNQPAGDAGQQQGGGGIGWTVGIALALLAFGLGFVAALALSYANRVKRLERRLAGYDHARPQPDWDRLESTGPRGFDVQPDGDPVQTGSGSRVSVEDLRIVPRDDKAGV